MNRIFVEKKTITSSRCKIVFPLSGYLASDTQPCRVVKKTAFSAHYYEVWNPCSSQGCQRGGNGGQEDGKVMGPMKT